MATTKRDLAPTSYTLIKDYSIALKDYIKKNGNPFGLNKFPYCIVMDSVQTKGLARLQSELGCKKLLCVLGIGPDKNGNSEFKISFLGLNEKGEVDQRHKLEPGKDIPGEETWPPEDTITDPATTLP